MSADLVVREDRNLVAYLTLNSPDKLNVLSEDMLASLQSRLDELSRSPTIRCVVLKGNGKAFCAGHDLRELSLGRQSPDSGRSYFKSVFDRCARLMISIVNLPQPVVAQVHGVAVAAGCQLVATCDMAVASSNARFGVNGVNIGLFCSTPMVALSRNVSRKHAFELLTTGRLIDAERALQIGLVNQVVDPGDLQDSVAGLADLVSSKLSSAVKIGKSAFYEQAQMNLGEAYIYTGKVMVENMMHSDTAEGIAAFLEKRQPNWSDAKSSVNK